MSEIRVGRFQVLPIRGARQDAFAKAPGDVVRILDRLGFVPLALDRQIGRSRLLNLILWPGWSVKVLWSLLCLPSGSVVFIQLPSSFYDLKIHSILRAVGRIRRIKYVCLFHDLSEIQHKAASDMGLNRCTRSLIGLSDEIIVHNSRMRRWLAERGVPNDKMIELRLFDYLFEGEIQKRSKHDPVIIAGMISQKKCTYLRRVGELGDIRFNLYGPCNDVTLLDNPRLNYCGSFPPDVLPGKIVGGWGLVWDSQSIDTCDGATGNYLRYNNPHKASLYLAAGIPLIVWSESALAPLVEEMGVGICVNTLRGLGERIERISDEQYAHMLASVKTVSGRLRSGDFLKKAFSSDDSMRGCCVKEEGAKRR